MGQSVGRPEGEFISKFEVCISANSGDQTKPYWKVLMQMRRSEELKSVSACMKVLGPVSRNYA